MRAFPGREMPTAVEALIEHSFAISRAQFWVRRNQPVRDATGLRRFRRRLRRLLAGEPLAYILKEKEFYGESFFVSRAVLIPRPETELLVEKALDLLGRAPAAAPRGDGAASSRLDGAAPPRSDGVRILDIGSGSGCIAVILALRTRGRVIALEKSRPALRTLKRNIDRFGLRGRVRPLCGDLFPVRGGIFDMIVANPPYLSSRDWRRAPRTVRLHEPRQALLAGPRGTEVLQRIIACAPERLVPGGWLLLEIGQGQRRAVQGFLKAAGLTESECVHDYAGIERVIVAQRD